MKSAKGWQWLCIGMMAAAFSLATTGCGGGDDDDADGGTTPADGTTPAGGTTPTNGVSSTGTTLPIGTTIPIVEIPALKTMVLLDITQAVDGKKSFGVLTKKTPAAGTVKIEASWIAIDLIAAGAPLSPYDLEFWVNKNPAPGIGGFHNPGHPSPLSGSVAMPANVACNIQVYNNQGLKTVATVHLKATWKAN